MSITAHEVTVPCVRCGNDIDVRVVVSGRRIPATRTDPAEGPDIDVTDIECETGCRLTSAELNDICRAAQEQVLDLGEDLDDCGPYDTIRERDDDY